MNGARSWRVSGMSRATKKDVVTDYHATRIAEEAEKRLKRLKERTCETCICCIYLGEGDFACDERDYEHVIENWIPVRQPCEKWTD